MESLPLGVVLERREVENRWIKHRWLPVAVLPGAPARDPRGDWRSLETGEGWERFHAGTLPLELFGQLSRTLSLTLRLFGNVLSGEMIVAVIFSLVPLIAPLPLTGLTMFTGLLQAYIFTSLAAVFIGAGVEASE